MSNDIYEVGSTAQRRKRCSGAWGLKPLPGVDSYAVLLPIEEIRRSISDAGRRELEKAQQAGLISV